MGVRIKFEGAGRWSLRNEGAFDGNRTFYFLEGLRKEGFSQRLSTGEGPHGVFGSVKVDQLDELRSRMAAARVEEVRG